MSSNIAGVNSGASTSAGANSGSSNAASNPGVSSTNHSQPDVLYQSKDAQTMISVLKDMGIYDFEPKIVNQLLEFSYRMFMFRQEVFPIISSNYFTYLKQKRLYYKFVRRCQGVFQSCW